jgi:hypothetical protein
VIGWCNLHGSSVLRPGPIAWLNAALRDAERVDVLPCESRFRWAHHMACQAAPRQRIRLTGLDAGKRVGGGGGGGGAQRAVAAPARRAE